MQPQISSRVPLGRREEGIALIVTMMVLLLVSVLMVGFVAAVIADTRAGGLERDQTQAYAASHAGLEQITSDLSALFGTDFSPNATQIAGVRANPPVLTGFNFIAPGGGSGSGYWVAPRFTDASGNPLPEDAVNGSTITQGPYQGFRGIITPYDITVTARSNGGAEVRMRRTLQTVAIPVFQFGMFSELDLAFHSGETFNMTGRVHTNGNLFLAEGTGQTLTIADRVTAVGQIVRTNLPNGVAASTSYGGTIRIPTLIAANPASNVYRNLAMNEGSLTGTVPPAVTPMSSPNPNWTKLSVGTYANNIRNGDTGAKRLDLPLVADRNSDGIPDAQPIELIRRPAQGSNENTANPFVYQQRFFSQASLRILLSDTAADIMNLPTITTAQQPIRLSGDAVQMALPVLKLQDYGTTPVDLMRSPIGLYENPAVGPSGTNYLPASVYKGSHNESVVNGFIKIEMQRNDGTWTDVTRELLGLGISGRNLADANIAVASRWNSIPNTVQPSPIPVTGTGDICAEPHANAVIRLQRVRDIPTSLAPCGIDTNVAGDITGTVTAVSQEEHDYWPLALYDPREGHMRDGLANNTVELKLGGIINYVELDVMNLRRWLRGEIGSSGTNAKNDNGFIIYFSDRRNNRSNNLGTGVETAEYGWEDVVNAANTDGAPNFTTVTTPELGEDLNGNGTLETYGRFAQNVPGGALAPLTAAAVVTNGITGSNIALIARANRTLFFRRALKLVNGGIYTNFTSGLTITSENPVYVQGDYNATSASTTAAGAIPSAIIADAVTFLSNNWNDIRSFTNPASAASPTSPAANPRTATTTGYRMAIVSGKSLTFLKPSYADASFGSDGGAHNFLRTLEYWTNTGTALRYRGSLVSFFISRQAVGTFKCCDFDVYDKPDVRDFAFDTDFLLPSRLPPGTPMFRDVNTLTFRQILRPTQ